jgi:predicted DNA-binding transcriptional regulator AlpA
MDAIEMHRQQMPVRLLGWEELRAKGITSSKPTIYRRIKAGQFPKPVYPGKSPAWVESEVDAHLLSLIAQRDGGAPRNGAKYLPRISGL